MSRRGVEDEQRQKDEQSGVTTLIGGPDTIRHQRADDDEVQTLVAARPPDIGHEDTEASGEAVLDPTDETDVATDLITGSDVRTHDTGDLADVVRTHDTGDPTPGESFTGAPTATRESVSGAEPADFPALTEVDPDYYVFGSEIARGGMGRIMTARDRRSGRVVAIKEILPHLIEGQSSLDKDSLLARFQREARVTARLQHPAIVPVYEIGTFDGNPFFAMKKVDGQGLDTVISDRKTLVERMGLLPIVISVAEALAYAHDQRVIHRDLKSSNILVGEFGETVVIDWGLAKDLSEDDKERADPSGVSFDSENPLKTVAGSIFGTPHFMPPEQARGDVVDERADVYAIGSILYHLLSGRPPYVTAGTEPASDNLLAKLRSKPPQPLVELVPDVPRDLLSIVDKAMSRDKAQRYRTAAELSRDLGDFEAGQLVAVHKYSAKELAGRWLRRHRAAVATAFVLAMALIVTAVISIRSVVNARDDARMAASVANDEKKRADDLTDEAMSFLAERGRIDFIDDRPSHALILLSKAYEHYPDLPSIRMMMRAAMRSVDALQFVLQGHTGAINHLLISDDRSKLVSSSSDGTIRIWSVESGDLLTTLKGHVGEVYYSSFSEDGTKIISAGSDGTARIWSTSTGALLKKLETDGLCLFADFDSRGRAITASAYGQLNAWDPASGEVLASFKDHVIDKQFPPAALRVVMSYDRKTLVVSHVSVSVIDLEADVNLGRNHHEHTTKIEALAVTADGSKFVTGDSNGVVILWDSRSVQPIAHLNNHEPRIRALALSGDGSLLAFTAGENHITVLDLNARKVVAKLEGARVGFAALAFSPDSEILLTLGHDEVARLWDARSGRRRASLVGHAKIVTASVFSADGSLFVGDLGGGIRKWDATVDVARRELPSGDARRTVLDPTGRRLVIGSEQVFRLYDASTLELVTSVKDRSAAVYVRFSTDGERFFTGSRVWNSSDGTLIRDFGHASEPISTNDMTGDGRIAGISDLTGLMIWNVDSGKMLFKKKPGRFGMFIPFYLDPRGEYGLALLGDEFRLQLFDLATGAVHHRFPDRGLRINLITFLRRKDVAVFNRKRGLDVVNLKTGKVERHLDGDFTDIVVGRDGVRILAAHHGVAILWNTETGEKELEVWNSPGERVFGLAISADGAFIAVGSKSAVSLWDRVTEQLLWRSSIGGGIPRGIYFHPTNGSLIVDTQERVLVFDIGLESRSPAEVRRIVEDKVPRMLEQALFFQRSSKSPGKSGP